MASHKLAFYACLLFKLLSKHEEVVLYSVASYKPAFYDWSAAYLSSTNWTMLASIKNWVNTHYGMLADSGGTSKTFGSFCYITSTSQANKWQHKFQPGVGQQFINFYSLILFAVTYLFLCWVTQPISHKKRNYRCIFLCFPSLFLFSLFFREVVPSVHCSLLSGMHLFHRSADFHFFVFAVGCRLINFFVREWNMFFSPCCWLVIKCCIKV